MDRPWNLLDLRAFILMSGQARLDWLGRATARAHAFLKRHPRLRGRVIDAYNFVGSIGDSIGRKERRELSGTTDIHEWIEDWNAGPGGSIASIRDVLSAEETRNQPPRGLHGRIDPEYHQAANVAIPSPFVAEVPGGHVLGEHGAVATPDGKVISRASRPVGSLNAHLSGYNANDLSPDALRSDWMRRPKRLKEAATISTFVGRGYFHWLFDILPRLYLLREAGFDPQTLEKVIIPSYFARYQIETLNRFGIGRDQIITSFQNRHIIADRLIVPSHPRETGLIPEWVCAFLRDTFEPEQPPGVDKARRIYIVRRATDHGILENEARLTARLVERGFVPLAMEDFSLEEKAWLLGQAEVVVGPSGGGLANIVFCHPGAIVVEIRVQPYPVMEAWDIGNRLGLEFYDVLPRDYERSSTMDAAAAGEVSDDEVLATLDLAGVKA